MISVETKDGFKVDIDERVLTDWRLTHALVKSQKGTDYEKLEATDEIAILLIGKENSERLMQHIMENNDGFVPGVVYMNTIAEIFQAVKESKN